ncbi:MAG: glycosyltransferase family 4 protein [Bacteroidales bacterium]|nr:glycosyltransferase family 4 protein [Bacteroidales bacterium]
MHILYNIAGFYRPAGMERVLCDKANWLVEHGHRVTILTTEQQGRPYAFPLDSRVVVIDLAIGYEDNNGGSLWDKLAHYPGKQRRHRKALDTILAERKPDITVSMFCNEVNLIPQLHDGSKKVLEVHFSRFKRMQYGRKGLWALADSIRSRQDAGLVRKYDRFVVLTEEDKGLWGPMDTIRVIPNPVRFRPEKPALLDTKTVIAVGRYTHQKGLERLVEAWSLIREKVGWTLRLVGDGEDRPALEKQIQDLGLGSSVLLGKVESDMAKVYSCASILALSSRYEGLPMALLECQAFGVPAVAFDCKCGPREIIQDGKTGILVDEGDIPSLAAALESLMHDDTLRKAMGQNAFCHAEAWRPEVIMPQWIRLFSEIL